MHRKAKKEFGSLASLFMREAWDHLGVEVFMLVGYQSKDGSINRGK
jgi:hypothetical protein